MRLSACDAAVSDHFGIAVALSGDTTVVGASDDDAIARENLVGSGCVFLRSGTVWTQQVKLLDSDEGTGDQFGISLKISGDRRAGAVCRRTGRKIPGSNLKLS